MKKYHALLAVVASLTVTACGLPATFYAEPFSKQVISGSDFNAELAKAYQQRVNNSIDFDENWILAGMYAQKGDAAVEGQTVLPWDFQTYQEQPAFTEGVASDRAAKYNLAGLRSQLMTALDNGGRNRNPYACAQAQAHYDWLIDETFQDTPPAQVDEEDKIATDFNKFLGECVGQSPVAEAPKAEPAAATEWVIYFGWDRYDLTAEAQQVVGSVVSSVKALSNQALSVVGYTDTSGNTAYNQKLSQNRSANVAGALNAGGVSGVQQDARGETNLAKPTADGVREPLNRRAVITLK